MKFKFIERIKKSDVFLVLIGAIALIVIWKLYGILFVIFGGVLLAIALSSLISFISRKTKLSWRISFFVSIMILSVLAIVFFYLLYATFVNQFVQFIQEFPQSGEGFEVVFENLFGFELPDHIIKSINSIFSSALAFDTLKITLEVISRTLILLALVLYFSFNPSDYLSLFDKKTQMVLIKSGKDLRLWLIGTFYSMIIIGVMTTVTLYLLGVPYALVLGLIAGLLEFIPYVGPVLSWVPGVIIATSINPSLALYVTIAYAGIQIVEGYLLVPVIQKEVVSFPPAYHIISIAIFGTLFGFLGIFFAVPVVIASRAVLKAIRESRD